MSKNILVLAGHLDDSVLAIGGIIRKYTNAGHNPPCLRRRNGETEFLNSRHGPALGVVPDAEYGSEAVLLGDNVAHCADTLFSYGVKTVFLAEDKRLEPFTVLPYAKVIMDLIKEHV